MLHILHILLDQLSLRKDISQVFGDNRALREQLSHLRLREPNRFLF